MVDRAIQVRRDRQAATVDRPLATLPASRRAGYVDDQLQGRVVTDGSDLDRLEISWELASGLAWQAFVELAKRVGPIG